jgi:hypothetical protein
MAARYLFVTTYLTRSRPRCAFDRACFDVRSNSQSTHTNAVPKLTTMPRKTNVKAGVVSMFNIPDAMQTAYQLRNENGLGVENTEAAYFIP